METSSPSGPAPRSTQQGAAIGRALLAAVLATRLQFRVHPLVVAILDEQIRTFLVAIVAQCGADNVRRVGKVLDNLERERARELGSELRTAGCTHSPPPGTWSGIACVRWHCRDTYGPSRCGSVASRAVRCVSARTGRHRRCRARADCPRPQLEQLLLLLLLQASVAMAVCCPSWMALCC